MTIEPRESIPKRPDADVLIARVSYAAVTAFRMKFARHM
jgi:hypothetical protein